MQKATAGERFLAALIDGIISGVAQSILVAASTSLLPLAYLVSIGYLLTKDSLPFLEGQSIGKKVMKIKVIKDATGQGIVNDWGTGVIRGISLVIPFFNIVDACMVLGAEGKRFGDKWAGTTVVKAA